MTGNIFGKTVGIIGTGRIGRIAAQIFRGFGAVVVAYDPFPAHDWAIAMSIIPITIGQHRLQRRPAFLLD